MQPDEEIQLRTDRLRLRPLRNDDAERLVHIANDIRIARNMLAAFPHPYTSDDATQFLASDPAGLAVELLDPPTDDDVGMIGVVGGDQKTDAYQGVCSFGYWFGVDYWGQGFATEAGQAFLNHIIASYSNEVPLRRIEAAVYGWNPASANVLTKLGFELDGRLPNRIIRFGEITDELFYGKILQ